MPKDACYYSVKPRYRKFPSARASQAIAKCRKKSGTVRKTEEGTDLKRWQAEKWQDTKSGNLVGLVERMNTAAPLKEFLVKLQKPKVKLLLLNSELRKQKSLE